MPIKIILLLFTIYTICQIGLTDDEYSSNWDNDYFYSDTETTEEIPKTESDIFDAAQKELLSQSTTKQSSVTELAHNNTANKIATFNLNSMTCIFIIIRLLKYLIF